MAELAAQRILGVRLYVLARDGPRGLSAQRPHVAVALVVDGCHHLALRIDGYVLDGRLSFWYLFLKLFLKQILNKKR